MAKRVSELQQYINSSQSIHYSLLLTLPILAIYEFGIIFLFRNSFFELRNSGEILIRSFFTSIHLTNPYLISAILLGSFLIVMIRGYRIEKRPGIHANYFIYMLIESMVWGTILYFLLQFFTRLPFQMIKLEDKIANLNLALGAGIFEEFIFRLVIIGVCLVILQRGFALSRTWSISLAIFFSAVVFAGFHLFMEAFYLPIFMQRIFGGVILGILFHYRGYGISVYTHVIYNFLILAETW